MPASASPRHRGRDETHCQTCSLSALCLPLALTLGDMKHFDAIVRRSTPLRKGEPLFRQGATFTSVFAVRSGSLKQVVQPSETGAQQLTGFFLPSELAGLDGIDQGAYPATAIALETTTVCEIPFNRLDHLSQSLPELRGQLYRSMGRELQESRQMMRLLSRKTADQRLASFLLTLSARFRRRGFSPYSFRLSMTRADMGSYLGLAVETVSRTFSRLQEHGVVAVSGRDVLVLDMPCLIRLGDEAIGDVSQA